MVIEIKQLIIRAVVEERRSALAPVATSVPAVASARPRQPSGRATPAEARAQRDIVAACAREAVRLLRKERGR